MCLPRIRPLLQDLSFISSSYSLCMATAVVSSPLPAPLTLSRPEAPDVSAPYTPTSSGSLSLSPSPSRRPSSHHHKANSVSAAVKEVTAILLPKRPLSLQEAAPPMADSLKLPPSPPLTHREVDLADSDSTHEHDITEAWRGSARVSRDDDNVPRPRTLSALSAHPLAAGPSSSSHADIDLEKGPDPVVKTPSQMVPKPPKSSYYLGPPAGPTAYGTPPVGQLGVHYPREIVRVERDYDHGELVQFSSAYPLELQGRINPTQFLETINVLNEGLIRAHSLNGALIYNTLAILTLWISPLFLQSRYEKEMEKLKYLVDVLNGEVYNPVGLNILWPRRNAFLFLEIEYY